MFNCDHCHLTFVTAWDLNLHMGFCHVDSSQWQQSKHYWGHPEKYTAGASPFPVTGTLQNVPVSGTSQNVPVQKEVFPHFKEIAALEQKNYNGTLPEHSRESALYSKLKLKDSSSHNMTFFGQAKDKLPYFVPSDNSGLLSQSNFQSVHGFPTVSTAMLQSYDLSSTSNYSYNLNHSSKHFRSLLQNRSIAEAGNVQSAAEENIEKYSYYGMVPDFTGNNRVSDRTENYMNQSQRQSVDFERPVSENSESYVNHSQRQSVDTVRPVSDSAKKYIDQSQTQFADFQKSVTGRTESCIKDSEEQTVDYERSISDHAENYVNQSQKQTVDLGTPVSVGSENDVNQSKKYPQEQSANFVKPVLSRTESYENLTQRLLVGMGRQISERTESYVDQSHRHLADVVKPVLDGNEILGNHSQRPLVDMERQVSRRNEDYVNQSHIHSVDMGKPVSDSSKNYISHVHEQSVDMGKSVYDSSENFIGQSLRQPVDMERFAENRVSEKHKLSPEACHKVVMNFLDEKFSLSGRSMDDPSSFTVSTKENTDVMNENMKHTTDQLHMNTVGKTVKQLSPVKCDSGNAQNFFNQSERGLDNFTTQVNQSFEGIKALHLVKNYIQQFNGENSLITNSGSLRNDNDQSVSECSVKKSVEDSAGMNKSTVDKPLGKPGKKRGRKPAGEKAHCCRFCGMPFAKKVDLEVHVKVHVDEFTFRCIMCSEAFENSPGLRKHRKLHKSATAEKMYECILCGALLRSWPVVEVHMRSHTGERPFRCDLCGADFAAQYGLKKHLRIHTGEKPYKCDQCTLKFWDKSNLENHQRTHTGEKPFQCSLCGNKFSLKNSLRVHMMMHGGKTPFGCDVCGRKFYRKQHLTTHKRVHTGERPYPCLVCGKAFTRNHHLTIHVRQHTGEKPYKCTQCDMAFIRKSHLDVHLKHHSREVTLSKIKVPFKPKKNSGKKSKTRIRKPKKLRKKKETRKEENKKKVDTEVDIKKEVEEDVKEVDLRTQAEKNMDEFSAAINLVRKPKTD